MSLREKTRIPVPTTTVAGVVIGGDQRGRVLGFPTANIALEPGRDALRFGVYAGRALDRPAAVSIGVRPTFGEGLTPLVEAHILGFEGDLYGQQLEVELLAYLRPELRFERLEELVEQIAVDCADTQRVFDAAASLR